MPQTTNSKYYLKDELSAYKLLKKKKKKLACRLVVAKSLYNNL